MKRPPARLQTMSVEVAIIDGNIVRGVDISPRRDQILKQVCPSSNCPIDGSGTTLLDTEILCNRLDQPHPLSRYQLHEPRTSALPPQNHSDSREKRDFSRTEGSLVSPSEKDTQNEDKQTDRQTHSQNLRRGDPLLCSREVRSLKCSLGPPGKRDGEECCPSVMRESGKRNSKRPMPCSWS
jgi:hypothetical protein